MPPAQTLDARIQEYQKAYCGACGLGCAAKSVAMTLCVKARILELRSAHGLA